MAKSLPTPRLVESPNGTQPESLAISREVVEYPRRAGEIELVGQMQDTAFVDGQWLICWGDSNYIQSTKLLYHILLYSDGLTSLNQIAQKVSSDIQSELTGEQVEWLILNRLASSGLLDLSGPRPAGFDKRESAEDPNQDEVIAKDANKLPGIGEMPLLGIRYRLPLLPYRITEPVTSVLQHLYWPPLMVSVLIVAVAINLWVALDANVWGSIQAVLFNPELALVLIGLELSTTLFHELGHAAALRRAGTRYGAIGFAIYIIWPVFYTDVTHVYRLKRTDRLRVDTGGMYFQLVAMIVLFGAYLIVGHGIFLLAILLTTASFFGQFSPFLRFDGYYIVADIMGVHEPLSLVGPYIRDHLPWPRNRQRQLPPMKRFSKIVFILYLVAVVVFLTYPFAIGAVAGEKFIRSLADSGQTLWSQLINAWSTGEQVAVLVAVLQLVMWFLVPLGLLLFAYTIVRQLTRGLLGFARLIGDWTASILVNRRTRVWLGVVQVIILLAGMAIYAADAGIWQPTTRASMSSGPVRQNAGEAEEKSESLSTPTPQPGPILTGDPDESSPETMAPSETARQKPIDSAGDLESVSTEVPAVNTPASLETAVPVGTSVASPSVEVDEVAEIVQRVLASEESLTSGEFTAEILNPDGSRATANLSFDLSAEAGASFKQVTTYSGSGAARTDDWITVGELSWQRQPDGAWLQLAEQEGVPGRLGGYLPSSSLSAESGAILETESDNEAILRWYDAVRDADISLTVTPSTGVPIRLSRTQRISGSVLTVQYDGWNSPVQISRPEGS